LQVFLIGRLFICPDKNHKEIAQRGKPQKVLLLSKKIAELFLAKAKMKLTLYKKDRQLEIKEHSSSKNRNSKRKGSKSGLPLKTQELRIETAGEPRMAQRADNL